MLSSKNFSVVFTNASSSSFEKICESSSSKHCVQFILVLDGFPFGSPSSAEKESLDYGKEVITNVNVKFEVIFQCGENKLTSTDQV